MSGVPFADLSRQHSSMKSELQTAFDRVVGKGDFILGAEVKHFEEEWANFTGAKAAIGCSNGTDSLVLILLALGIGPGDEVITVSHTFFATVEAIQSVGATPILVDILPRNGLMDPQLIEPAITPRTKAIIPVHLYGQPVELDEILAVSEKYNLYCIQDAAQAHGALYKKKPLANYGIASSYSFYPGKNLGALGDAGAVVTNDLELAKRMRSLRDHGRSEKYSHNEFGWNMRMDGLQAAFLSAKLPKLSGWNDDRKKVAAMYLESLRELPGLTFLEISRHVDHVFHLFVVCHEQRDDLQRKLKAEGVATGIHYPLGCHQQTAWKNRYGEMNLPHTEKLARTCLSLPIFGEMREEEAMMVVSALRRVLS